MINNINKNYFEAIVRGFDGSDEILEEKFRMNIGVFHRSFVDIGLSNNIITRIRDSYTKEKYFMLLRRGNEIQKSL